MIEIPNVASKEDCQRVINAYERCRAGHAHQVGDGFFDHRVLWINSFPDAENETRRILQNWRWSAVDAISQSVGCRLYSDTIQVVGWNGQEMPPHQDDRHPDGKLHNTPWREWASIIYLNDDFEGGELYFLNTGCETEVYRPLQGSLVFFKGCRWHGVKAVRQGVRYTAPSWYSRDPAHEDRYARVEY